MGRGSNWLARGYIIHLFLFRFITCFCFEIENLPVRELAATLLDLVLLRFCFFSGYLFPGPGYNFALR